MTADEFKVQSASDVAVWFRYLGRKSENFGRVWFKDIQAKQYYEKFRNIFDNVYTCLSNEGVNIKDFVSSYFTKPGSHSPRGLQTAVESRCSDFYKSVRHHFKKTVRNISDAMSRRQLNSSQDVLNVLCETGMLAPNFLAGKISVYWLAGVPEICDILKTVKPGWLDGKSGNRVFRFGDDFASTFDRFLKQRDVYYHILCKAFDRMDKGVDSLAVTNKYHVKQKTTEN